MELEPQLGPFRTEEDGFSIGKSEYQVILADLKDGDKEASQLLASIEYGAEMQDERYHLPDSLILSLAKVYVDDAAVGMRDQMKFADDSLRKASWLMHLAAERGLIIPGPS